MRSEVRKDARVLDLQAGAVLQCGVPKKEMEAASQVRVCLFGSAENLGPPSNGLLRCGESLGAEIELPLCDTRPHFSKSVTLKVALGY